VDYGSLAEKRSSEKKLGSFEKKTGSFGVDTYRFSRVGDSWRYVAMHGTLVQMQYMEILGTLVQMQYKAILGTLVQIF